MKQGEFYIGLEFFTGGGKWRCTDIGTRVIVAISLEPQEGVIVSYDENKQRHQSPYISTDPRDLLGPPYSIVEHVFDEYDFDGCYLTAEEVPYLVSIHRK